jgi:probable F420-dependent oxidoreductase
MRLSAGLATCMEGMMYPVPFADVEGLISMAVTAEKLGFHSIWGNDHLTTQAYVRKSYSAPPNFWELLVTYSFLAAKTSNLRLGTGLLITPMRGDIVVVAKQLATIDVLSGGRLMLGIGVGAYREEFEALHPGLDAHRGSMVEESIKALRMLFESRRASFDGQYYRFQDIEMYPKPQQHPLPLYIGGNSKKALERTAKYADGWLGAALTPERLREKHALLRRYLSENNRQIGEIDVAMQCMIYIGSNLEDAVARFKRSQMYHHHMSLLASTLKGEHQILPEEMNLIGTADMIIERIRRLEEAGLTHLCGLYFVGDSVREVLDQMEKFAEDVMPDIVD